MGGGLGDEQGGEGEAEVGAGAVAAEDYALVFEDFEVFVGGGEEPVVHLPAVVEAGWEWELRGFAIVHTEYGCACELSPLSGVYLMALGTHRNPPT